MIPTRFSRERSTSSGRARLSDTGAIVVTHHRADLARACAERLLEEIEPRSLVVVVNDPDNAPETELDWLRANAGVSILNEVARGYGANVNAAARRLRGLCRYYLVMNDDVQLPPGSIAGLRSLLESDSRAGVTAPRLVDADGVPQPVAHRFPSIASELASALILPRKLTCRLWDRFVLADGVASFWLVGAVLLVRAAAFDEVGGFDEEFFLYSEETDLIRRMRDRGWSPLVCEDVVAVHLGAESTAAFKYRRLRGFSRRKYIQKHWPRHDRSVLSALLCLVHVWNSLYVLGRIGFEPWSFRAKLRLWAAHWDNRTAPRLRRTWHGADV